MKEHEHATGKTPDTRPARNEVAKKAYGIHPKEGRPAGRDVQNRLEAGTSGMKEETIVF